MLRPSSLDGTYEHDVLAQREIGHHFFKYNMAIGSKRRSIQEMRYSLTAKRCQLLQQKLLAFRCGQTSVNGKAKELKTLVATIGDLLTCNEDMWIKGPTSWPLPICHSPAFDNFGFNL